jgi:hypothetical protein
VIKIKVGFVAIEKLVKQRSVTFKPVGRFPEIQIFLSDDVTITDADTEEAKKIWKYIPRKDMN